MATVQDRINSWRTGEIRGASQVNNAVALNWYNRGLKIFQKALLEYVANQLQITEDVKNITAGESEYTLPFNASLNGLSADFYSVAQLRVAYKYDKNGYPLYRVCEPINIADYNITPKGHSAGEPYIRGRISKLHPRYMFIGKNKIRIFPTPDKTITNGRHLTFNYITKEITDASTSEDNLGVPTYFLDAVEDYLTYRLINAENPELAQIYYQRFIDTIHDNIYGLNRDQRPVEENFADLRGLYIN